MATVPTALPHDAAYELAAAWIMSVCSSRGIRALVIKGPILEEYGLREKRTSADVDVLVDPAFYDDLCAQVVAAGWQLRPNIFLGELVNHSAAFMRDGWPVDLDVHHHYPGFLAAPQDAFDALWMRRASGRFANRRYPVLDRPSSILVLALHSLRGPARQSRHVNELEQLARIQLSSDERRDLLDLATATGCELTLEGVLPRLGIAVPRNSPYSESPELHMWRRRVRSGSQGAYYWIVALREAPARKRLSILWRAFWPTRNDLLLARPNTVDTVAGRLAARARRLAWGAQSLVQYFRAAR